ncbi:epoxide hydrolase family protein [Paraburkholderia sp. C35]|uniref:epoxide hydrolase family protein n=1 Tax=Paraburkholderia sp. C35 TaxID=2126993 RepID=UPI001EF475D4|nr:epoxide hydrolase family protein [Paraburkholderia sp. C35]
MKTNAPDFGASEPNKGRRSMLQMASALAALPFMKSAEAASNALLTAPAPFTLPAATEAVTSFRVAIAQSQLDDLHRRLALVRWPDQETVAGWVQGVPLDSARELIHYWQTKYDWRRFERQINRYPQYRTSVDGLGIHFLHVRSKHPDAMPIILTHGWPGSVIEFLDIIGPLTDPTAFGGNAADAFDVVIPSLPGFGFSDRPGEKGWDVVRTAKAWATLMNRLGYKRWVAQGGDWGTGVTHALGHIRPDGLIAAHVNWPLVFPQTMPAHLTPEQQAAVDGAAKFTGEGGGYFKEHATKPQTIGYALADSPSGQANWMYEKFIGWADNANLPDGHLSFDKILDNITLYWLTNTSASSARFYWEATQAGLSGFSGGTIELPMAATIFPHEIYRAPRDWAQAAWPNLFYWSEVSKGGHFAAMEQPALFAQEMRLAFQKIRTE